MRFPGDDDGIAGELFDETVSLALAHVLELKEHLGAAAEQSGPELDGRLEGCREDVHKLLVDIVSLRNAAELLRRARYDQAG